MIKCILVFSNHLKNKLVLSLPKFVLAHVLHLLLIDENKNVTFKNGIISFIVCRNFSMIKLFFLFYFYLLLIVINFHNFQFGIVYQNTETKVFFES